MTLLKPLRWRIWPMLFPPAVTLCLLWSTLRLSCFDILINTVTIVNEKSRREEFHFGDPLMLFHATLYPKGVYWLPPPHLVSLSATLPSSGPLWPPIWPPCPQSGPLWPPSAPSPFDPLCPHLAPAPSAPPTAIWHPYGPIPPNLAPIWSTLPPWRPCAHICPPVAPSAWDGDTSPSWDVCFDVHFNLTLHAPIHVKIIFFTLRGKIP